MLVITILAILMIGVAVYQAGKPRNEIAPVEQDSVERQIAELFAGPDGAYVYKFTTTDDPAIIASFDCYWVLAKNTPKNMLYIMF